MSFTPTQHFTFSEIERLRQAMSFLVEHFTAEEKRAEKEGDEIEELRCGLVAYNCEELYSRIVQEQIASEHQLLDQEV